MLNDKISSEVTAIRTEVGGLPTSSTIKDINDTIAGMNTTMDGMGSTIDSINGTVNGISGTIDGIQGTVTTMQSNITQNANNINAKVSTTVGIAENGQKTATFGWNLTDEDWTIFNQDRNILIANEAGLEVTGKITATAGELGGFNIADNYLWNNNTLIGRVMGADNNLHPIISVGEVTTSGSDITITPAAQIIGDTIAASNAVFNNYLSSNIINCTELTTPKIKSSIGSELYFGYGVGGAKYTAKATTNGKFIYITIYNANGVETKLSADKTF